MADSQQLRPGMTILVPVYNEQDNIARVADEIKDYQSIDRRMIYALFVNDASTDNSQWEIEKVCRENKDFSYIELEKNTKLTGAVLAGFQNIDTELIGYLDADLQTTPADFPLLLQHIPEYDMVIGNRAHRADGFVRHASSRIANFIRQSFTNDGMDDTGCPLKVIKTEYARQIPLFRGMHRFLPALVQLQNGKVKQVTVRHFERTNGVAKFGVRNRLLSPLLDCFAYAWMKSRYLNPKLKSTDR